MLWRTSTWSDLRRRSNKRSRITRSTCAALVHDNWPRVAELVHQVIGRTLSHAPISVDELQWGGYFVIDEGTREVVGSCAYKEPAELKTAWSRSRISRFRVSRGAATPRRWRRS